MSSRIIFAVYLFLCKERNQYLKKPEYCKYHHFCKSSAGFIAVKEFPLISLCVVHVCDSHRLSLGSRLRSQQKPGLSHEKCPLYFYHNTLDLQPNNFWIKWTNSNICTHTLIPLGLHAHVRKSLRGERKVAAAGAAAAAMSALWLWEQNFVLSFSHSKLRSHPGPLQPFSMDAAAAATFYYSRAGCVNIFLRVNQETLMMKQELIEYLWENDFGKSILLAIRILKFKVLTFFEQWINSKDSPGMQWQLLTWHSGFIGPFNL